MEETVNKILVKGKGVFALDWSSGTITKKFAEVGLTSTPELNRVYRQMLLTTPGIEKFISGVILHNETIHQKLDNGDSFTEFLATKGIVAGARGDKGGDKFLDTEQDMSIGIEDLDVRLKEYVRIGVSFSKWRAGFKISNTYPTQDFLKESIARLTEFAKISQENNLIPFVEPDVEMSGNHTTTRCAEISSKVLDLLFESLKNRKVDITKIILKTNMVLPGKDSGVIAAPLEVANATLRVLRKSVPPEVPGIVFLSGGLSYGDSVDYLDRIEDLSKEDPWKLSFSFARALQYDALREWEGESKNIEKAQNVLLARLEKVSKARKGEL
jgi:fructose-bisphosphate aldolase class I